MVRASDLFWLVVLDGVLMVGFKLLLNLIFLSACYL
jgi:hypothetical protein